MGGRPTARVLAARLDADGPEGADAAVGARPGRRPEQVLVEEPLELRVDDVLVATTMRTPGHDFELAVGWCLSEGLLGPVAAPAAVRDIRYCATGSAVDTGFNTVSVTTSGGRPPRAARLGTVTSSCGVCGSDAVEALVLPPDLVARFDVAPPAARVHFDAFPRSVKRGILEWIQVAKKPETRAGRIDETVELAARNLRANQWRP